MESTTPILPLLTAAIAPGIALLVYFYLKDRYDYEPIHMVVRVFLLGFLIVFPIMIVQNGLVKWWETIRLYPPLPFRLGWKRRSNGSYCII